MERGPLLGILHSMKGTDKELHLYLQSEEAPVAIQNVTDVEELHSSAARHVSLVYQARTSDK